MPNRIPHPLPTHRLPIRVSAFFIAVVRDSNPLQCDSPVGCHLPPAGRRQLLSRIESLILCQHTGCPPGYVIRLSTKRGAFQRAAHWCNKQSSGLLVSPWENLWTCRRTRMGVDVSPFSLSHHGRFFSFAESNPSSSANTPATHSGIWYFYCYEGFEPTQM